MIRENILIAIDFKEKDFAFEGHKNVQIALDVLFCRTVAKDFRKDVASIVIIMHLGMDYVDNYDENYLTIGISLDIIVVVFQKLNVIGILRGDENVRHVLLYNGEVEENVVGSIPVG